jgi:hypothetical protein
MTKDGDEVTADLERVYLSKCTRWQIDSSELVDVSARGVYAVGDGKV